MVNRQQAWGVTFPVMFNVNPLYPLTSKSSSEVYTARWCSIDEVEGGDGRKYCLLPRLEWGKAQGSSRRPHMWLTVLVGQLGCHGHPESTAPFLGSKSTVVCFGKLPLPRYMALSVKCLPLNSWPWEKHTVQARPVRRRSWILKRELQA